jgi:hypothetical protein
LVTLGEERQPELTVGAREVVARAAIVGFEEGREQRGLLRLAKQRDRAGEVGPPDCFDLGAAESPQLQLQAGVESSWLQTAVTRPISPHSANCAKHVVRSM